MSRRNITLSYDEWDLICSELSDHQYHPFQLHKNELKEWKSYVKEYGKHIQHTFERVGARWALNEVKSSRAINILCREQWRLQDTSFVMNDIHNFIGFIINCVDNVSLDTQLEEWELIQNEMKDRIEKSDRHIWFNWDLVKLYHQSIFTK